VEDIGIATIQRLARFVAEVERIFWQIRAEAELGDDCALPCVFIDHLFATRARLATFYAISFYAYCGAVTSPDLIAGSILAM